MIKRKHTRIALDQTTRNQKRLTNTRNAQTQVVIHRIHPCASLQ
jgi:hypothetical protein